MTEQENRQVLDADAKKWLDTHFSGRIKYDEPMASHTSFRVGGPVEAYIEPQTDGELSRLVRWLHESNIPYLVVGGGTNLLVKDRGLNGLAINLRRCLKTISLSIRKGTAVTVNAMAGARLSELCLFAIDNGLRGMNFALGIPGSIGGAIMMNAGTSSGWMADVLDTVSVLLPMGTTERISRDKLDFSYRKLAWEKKSDVKFNRGRPIILSGIFRLIQAEAEALKAEAKAMLKTRQAKQPTEKPSAGCFFKNPAGGNTAGELIDRAGLKGMTVGGAAVSTRHANFIINRRRASATDIIALMTQIQQVVIDQFQIHLEPEVEIVGY